MQNLSYNIKLGTTKNFVCEEGDMHNMPKTIFPISSTTNSKSSTATISQRQKDLMIQLLSSRTNQTPNIHTTHKIRPQLISCVGLCRIVSDCEWRRDTLSIKSRLTMAWWVPGFEETMEFCDSEVTRPSKCILVLERGRFFLWIGTQVVAAGEAEEWL